MSKDLLLEIGTEEIPAGYIPPALKQMEERIIALFEEERIDFGEITTFGTPRRLSLYIKDVSEKTLDLQTEILGPHKGVAFSEDGKPTPAAIGFAKSQGVNIEELEIKETPKGEYLCVIKKVEGKQTFLVLKGILPTLITSISFPKSMHWEGDLNFARPIRWILALFDQDVIEFKLDGLNSGRITYGHRFLAPGPIEINHPSEYVNKLRKNYVLVLPQERKRIIKSGLIRMAKEIGGEPFKDDGLVEEVTYLVEYPVIIRGRFDEDYLKLPPEVLVAAMCEHQRYFPVEDEKGRLLNSFLVVSNGPEDAKETIRRGNERVLRARLEDASFFFMEDLKTPLWDRIEDEKERIFQEELGTMYEKTQRVVKLTEFLARLIDPELEEKARRAALLCKADLSTTMVGEFPQLQGIMGGYYARLTGESEEVAQAIQEHYRPRFAGDKLPETPIGIIVSLADKLDNIISLFSVGLAPTGSEDPYGLRRQAQGVVNMILENRIKLSLIALIKEAISLLDKKSEGTIRKIEAFFGQRIAVSLSERGIADDEIEATLAVGFDDPLDALNRAKALKEVRLNEDFKDLVVAFKRVVNILDKKGGGREKRRIREELLEEEAERHLYQVYSEIEEKVTGFIKEKDYIQALATLATLREPVDRFFDNVLVMVGDEEIRENRLALLSGIAHLFLMIADITRLRKEPTESNHLLSKD